MEYKIALLGPGNDGKSSYINRLITGDFKAFDNGNVKSAFFPSNIGEIKIHFVEANNPKDIDFSTINGIIIMFDMPNIEKLEDYIPLVDLSNKSIPKVMVGNKADTGKLVLVDGEEKHLINGIDIKEIFTTYRKKYSSIFNAFWLVSAKGCQNIEKPLLSIIRELSGKEVRFI